MPVTTRRRTPGSASVTRYPVKHYPHRYTKTKKRLCAKRKIPELGFENLGNTCWMNSTLQVFLRLSMAHKLMQHTRFDDPKTLTLSKSLAKLFTGDHHQGRLYPMLNLNVTTEIRKHCTDHYHLTDGIQHDSDEFLQRLVLIEPFASATEFIHVEKIYDPRDPIVPHTVQQVFDKNRSEIREKGNYTEFLKPLEQNKLTITLENILRLTLFDKDRQPLNTLEQCLDQYVQVVKPEVEMEGKDHFVKQAEFVSWPEVLVIELNRFFSEDVFDETGANIYITKGKRTSKKVQMTVAKHFVNVPNILRTHEQEYRLHGFVTHLGETLHSGHYIANVCKNRNKHWYEYSDVSVEDLDEDHLHGYDEHFNTNTQVDGRYILVYVKL